MGCRTWTCCSRRTGASWDDTKRYVDNVKLTEDDRGKIYELNTRRVYPRLAARLAGQ